MVNLYMSIMLGQSVQRLGYTFWARLWVFLDESHIWVEQFALPKWVCLVHCVGRPEQNKKAESGSNGSFCPLSLSWDIGLHLPSDLDWNVHHGLHQVLRPADLDWNWTIGSPGAPDCRPWDLSSRVTAANALWHLSHWDTYLRWVQFLWRTQTNTRPPQDQNARDQIFSPRALKERGK